MQSVMMRSGFLSSLSTVLLVAEQAEDFTNLCDGLNGEGLEVRLARTDREAEESLQREWVHAVVICVGSIDSASLALCRRVRKNIKTFLIPVFFLVPQASGAQFVEALRVGADDLIISPVKPNVLSAKIKSMIRRSAAGGCDKQQAGPAGGEQETIIRAGALTIYQDRYKVLVEGKSVRLTLTEFRILCLLASSPHRVFSRQHIIRAVHGEIADTTDRAVDSRISWLRKKLGPVGDAIENVRGIGYTFRTGSEGGSAAMN